MKKYTLPDGRTLEAGDAFTLDEIQYPRNWLELATPDDLESRGITVQEIILPETAPPTVEQIIAQYTTAVQRRLDVFFQSRGYEGILSAATYAASTVLKFQVEGQYAVEARDATWAKCYEILAAVEGGTSPMPTEAELLAELPPLVWPQ